MASLAETRDAGSQLPLPRSVRRICCIGDSITYGQGVEPRRTLAMHIARFVNMLYPNELIWVDNRGQSSGNIWHSWVPFLRLTKTIHFDAVVFSVCENDAQLLESNTVRYNDNYAETWLNGDQLREAVKETIVNIARECSAMNLSCILNYFTFREESAPLIDALARECKMVGLPFVDMLRYLQKESGLSVAQYISSPYDGHPSDAGHRAAARRIVTELGNCWPPPAGNAGNIGERLSQACKQALEIGWMPDEVFTWASLVLDAKETIARRAHPSLQPRSLDDLATARDEITQRYRGWFSAQATIARHLFLDTRRDEGWRFLEGAYASIRNLDEIYYVLKHLTAGTTAGEIFRAIQAAGYYTENQRLQPLPGDLKARFQQSIPTAQTGVAEPPPLQDYHALCRDLGWNLRLLSELLPDSIQPDSFSPEVERLWQVAFYLTSVATEYLEAFKKKAAPPLSEIPAKPASFTTIDVWVERSTHSPKRGGVYNMTVEIDYLQPLRSRRRSKIWAGVDEDSHVYHFEMPLLLHGTIGVGVPAWDEVHRRFLDGELRLRRVEISNFMPGIDTPRPCHVWESSQDSRHWLTLERILVPT